MNSYRPLAGVRVHRPVLVLLSLFLLTCTTRSQEQLEYSEDVEPIFRQGLDQYSAGQFHEAVATFDRILKNFQVNQRTTAAYVMKGKSQFRADQSLEATKTLRAFVAAYPNSSYIADAEYTLGLTQIRAGRYDDAVRFFLKSWEKAEPPQLRSDIIIALDGVIDSTYTVPKVRSLVDGVRVSDQRAYLWLKIGELNVSQAKITAAAVALDTLTRNYSVNPFQVRIASLRARVEHRGEAKLGLLLPLMKGEQSSPVKDLGTEILEGIQIAVDENNESPSARTKVTLDIRDTERDPLITTRVTQELTSDDEIVAIIGPVFSTTASAAVGLANARGVPLITPTANSNGIAAVGNYIFQANPDYDTRGRAMARFAVQQRGHHRLAVFAPIDTYAKYMAESFIKEAIRLGAEIVAQEWYQRGSTDFTIQLKEMRKEGMKGTSETMLSFANKWTREEIAKLVHLGVPRRTVDSLLEHSSVIGAEQLLGPDAKHLIDSMDIISFNPETKVDSLEYPVVGIDGLYVPINAPEEIGLVASQIVYFNIRAEILGSGEWNNLLELSANKRYCANVSFESDSYVPPEDSLYRAFVDGYFQRFRKRPTKNSLYGYDTAHLVLSLIQSGATTRETLARALADVKDVQSLHSKISFSPGRVNEWLQVLMFDGEQIRRLSELKVD